MKVAGNPQLCHRPGERGSTKCEGSGIQAELKQGGDFLLLVMCTQVGKCCPRATAGQPRIARSVGKSVKRGTISMEIRL